MFFNHHTECRQTAKSLVVGLWLIFPLTSADHGYSAPSYNAPSYNAPSYNAPKEADITHNHFHYYGLTPEYSAPKPTYDAPKPSYNAPSPSYGAPAPSYGAPKPTYDAPKPSYNAPSPSYGAPVPSYSAPVPSYAPPSTGYGAPATGYGAPATGYAAPAYPDPYAAQYPPDYGYLGGVFTEDPYLHVNKRELVGGALLLGAGIAKGVIITGLVNSLTSSTGIQIGKKK